VRSTNVEAGRYLHSKYREAQRLIITCSPRPSTPQTIGTTLLDTYYEVISKDPAYRFPMGYVKETQTGVFIPSSIDIVRQTLTQLIEKKIIDPTKPFLDAGCGDGRIVALASSLGIPAWGIESDEELGAMAKQNLINLHSLEVIKDTPAFIVHGDFCSDATYKVLGSPFSDFRTIYNYDNNYDLLAKKIAEDANPATVYVLYSGDESSENFMGLNLIDELVLNDQSGRPHVDLELTQAYVRIYRKES